MFILGITGGIGTGKSTVLDILKTEYNAYILEADKVAHLLMMPGKSAFNDIVATFGEDILTEEGIIDRNELGKRVMSDKGSLEKLNSIVHPAVKEYIIQDISEKRRGLLDQSDNTEKQSLYVIEAALLIQDGYKEICDEIWSIITSEDIRIERLIASRSYTEEKARGFIKNQPSDEYFISNSDIVLYNNGSSEELLTAIKLQMDSVCHTG